MSRAVREYTVGDYWLSQRRDGKAKGIWQITRYDARKRTLIYRSTHSTCLETAKAAIHAYEEQQRVRKRQDTHDAPVIANIMAYWSEKGKKADSSGQIASSFRQFIGFLMQDAATPRATVADLTPALFERFREWRMKPHSYEVEWAGKTFRHSSKGVRGESVQRNIEDVRSAINWQAKNGRLTIAPRIPSVPREMRSEAKDRVLTIEELGAIFGFAMDDTDMFRFLGLILATAVRTEAAAMFNPKDQFFPDRGTGLIDLHPKGQPRTKKVNPVVPCIPQFAPILKAWADEPNPVKSRKRRWRTLRRALELDAEIEPKSIRRTLATWMEERGLAPQSISRLLGHTVYSGATRAYAKYRPEYMAETRDMLTTIWDEVMAAASDWRAVHMRTTGQKGKTIVVDKAREEAQIS